MMIEFTEKQLDEILEYQKQEDCETVQDAVMKAINIALDHANKEKLKKCPFCGSKDVYISSVYDKDDRMTDFYKVICEECCISFECGIGAGKSSIIAAWNKRI